jgi:hypothetical protein
MIQDALPVKVIEEKKPEPKQSLVQEKAATKDEIDNTNAWAHAEQTQLKQANREQEGLQTSGMSRAQKSELLHQISNSAFNELKDDADPSRIPKTEE